MKPLEPEVGGSVGEAVIMAVAGAAFTFVPPLRADASAGPQGGTL
jgi:hypothetical protein